MGAASVCVYPMNDVTVCSDADNIFQTNQSLLPPPLFSLCPAVVEVKSSLPSGMQSPLGTASEQRTGGGEGGE